MFYFAFEFDFEFVLWRCNLSFLFDVVEKRCSKYVDLSTGDFYASEMFTFSL